MKDITAIIDHYRISARSVWNTAFWPDHDFRNWDSIDQFHSVERILFDALVLSKLDKTIAIEDIFRKPIPYIRVVPSAPLVPIMIQAPRPDAPRGYWDDPTNRVALGEAEIHFLAFFDWDQMNYRDLQYYHVWIAGFTDQPHLVGREALIERQHVNVVFSEE